ncbi:MAG: sugar ABC transporter permease [Clostridia bacterium]|nr:sugar ABC transporter permease [Clostridia bacterium]
MQEKETAKAKPKVKKRKYRYGHWAMTAMLSPAVIFVFIFSYLPMIGLIIAFQNYKYNLGMFKSPFVGFDNFKFLVFSDTFMELVRNTIGYNMAFIIFGMVAAVLVAVMMDMVHKKVLVKIYQSTMFLPFFLSWIVVSYITHSLFQFDYGIINNLIRSFGGEGISFYSEGKYWPLILTVVSIWKSIGKNSLVYYGAILSISPELYESASLDGCGGFAKFRYITLPHLKSTMIILTIMAIGGIFRSDYGLFYYLPKDSGALLDWVDVLDTYILRSIRSTGNIGVSSAAGFLQSIVGFVLVVATNYVVKRIDEDSSLF